MDIEELKCKHYFFDTNKFGRVLVFIDFGNVRPWAEDFWPEENKKRITKEIDIAKLADICNLVKPWKKLFYYGFFQKNENVDDDHSDNIKHTSSMYRLDKAKKSGFQVKNKEIKMISKYDEDGKYLGKYPKCNFDVEITMDILTKMPKYDTVMIFSGDSDFGGLLSYIKTKGKNVVVVCTRKRISKELQQVADVVVPAESLKDLLPMS